MAETLNVYTPGSFVSRDFQTGSPVLVIASGGPAGAAGSKIEILEPNEPIPNPPAPNTFYVRKITDTTSPDVDAIREDLDEVIAAQSAQVTIDRLPPGSALVIDYYKPVYGAANAWPTTRPTARTDLDVTWRGPTDPGSSLVLAGDMLDLVQGQ